MPFASSSLRALLGSALLAALLMGCGLASLLVRPTETPTAPPVTATPSPTPAELWRCPIQVTRTPPPAAPTLDPTQYPGMRVDPHLELCVSARQVKVGEEFSVQAVPVSIGLPYYTLYAQLPGGEAAALAGVTYDNQPNGRADRLELLEVLSSQASMHLVTFHLRALRAGQVKLWVSATGEIHYGYPGPATWAGGGSEPLEVTIGE